MSNLSSSERTLAFMILAKMLARTRLPARPRPSSWRSVLNALAWLCDDRFAGESVASIGVEQSSGQQRDEPKVVWLATNHPYPATVADHLRTVLDQLSGYDDLGFRAVEDSIVQICVERSRLKVFNYARMLLRTTSHAIEGATDRSLDVVHTSRLSADCNISQILDSIRRTFHYEGTSAINICERAYAFRRTASCGALREIVKSPGHDRNLSSIYHLIGRLGAWRHAASVLVTYAQTRPHFFDACVVKIVEQLEVELVFVEKPVPSISDVLLLILPRMSPDRLQEQFAHASGIPKLELQRKFRIDWNHRPENAHVHSEVSLLEHFHRFDLSFIDGDKYIGCSKPSCYFCDLYLRWHRLQPASRPCHYKLWMSWCLPAANEAAMSYLVKSNARFLQNVERYLEEDIRQTVLKGSPKRSNMFDSTADYTNSSRDGQ